MKLLVKVWKSETTVKTENVTRNILRIGKVCVIALCAIMIFSACSSGMETSLPTSNDKNNLITLTSVAGIEVIGKTINEVESEFFGLNYFLRC